MDIVERLRGHAKGNAGGVRELLVLSADEIERLRLSLMTFADNVKETNAGIDKNWAETVNSLKANNEQLRQQNAELRENNKLLYNLFHEAVALPQGACPRPATAGDGMFNPQHRALNKATGGE